MFTGLVQALGEVSAITRGATGARLSLRGGDYSAGVRLGDSVAINGCCLTVVEADAHTLHFDVGPETLARTNLGRLAQGSRVNVERSLRVGDELGGHLVTGHIDATGALDERRDEDGWSVCWFRLPQHLLGQVAPQGSIAVDGVSLTVVAVEAARFSVMLIPHTLSVTTLGRLQPGDPVNLETDLLAKYVERQFAGRSQSSPA
ncbi:MAG: riboflavin synthase [Pirellulales bacterium]|nr:riboflavin synthase [Pirellulales bacterium]